VNRNLISNPPDAAALMTTARSFGNYDLAGALADLVDNSIVAQAKQVDITCSYLQDGDCEVRIRDDGMGMSPEKLRSAMRPASANPSDERSADDLGRFGWGMKSASFSQCKVLTVVSRFDGITSGARWDLDRIDNWSMEVFDNDAAMDILETGFDSATGTELIWTSCDRLSENRTLTRSQFNDLIAGAMTKLALVFHRYISGDGGSIKPLRISVNGTLVPVVDPFCTSNIATTAFDRENIPVNSGELRSNIEMQAFTLPHFSKLTSAEYEKYGGEEGYLRNQGFYVYRNRRLIIWGTWFRLAKHGELSKLVRIRVDIPNTLDEMWKITVDKSDAQLPAVLKTRMKSLVDKFRNSSSKVFRSKGAKIDSGAKEQVWSKNVRNKTVRYTINRKHPLFQVLLAGLGKNEKSGLNSLMDMIETQIPIESINFETGSDPFSVQHSFASREECLAFVEASIPHLMRKFGDFDTLSDNLQDIEPYASNWNVVSEYIEGLKNL
jgi:hypothetical protein